MILQGQCIRVLWRLGSGSLLSRRLRFVPIVVFVRMSSTLVAARTAMSLTRNYGLGRNWRRTNSRSSIVVADQEVGWEMLLGRHMTLRRVNKPSHNLMHGYLNTWFYPQLNTCLNPTMIYRHFLILQSLSTVSLMSSLIIINCCFISHMCSVKIMSLRCCAHFIIGLCRWRFLVLWICILKMLRAARECSRMLIRMLCPTYVRNGTRIVVLFVQWRTSRILLLSNLILTLCTRHLCNPINLMGFTILVPCIHIHHQL